MALNQVVEVVATMAKLAPGLWQQVTAHMANHRNDDPECPDQERIIDDIPHWCICSKCVDMGNERENVCCRNAFKNHEHALFENHVLTEHNLELAMRSNSDYLNYPFDPNNNACWRFTAYRQYIMWYWGKLGQGNRKVIPSCIVKKIRDKFPDSNKNYTGFLDTEFAL